MSELDSFDIDEEEEEIINDSPEINTVAVQSEQTAEKPGFWERVRNRNRETLSAIRDATGNPDWEAEIILMQAEDYHRRGLVQEDIASNPEMPDEDRRWARGRLDSRDDKYVMIDPNKVIARKREDVSMWREWGKWIAAIIFLAFTGGSIVTLLFGG